MASSHDAHAHTDYVPGEMPIQEQASTFHGVMGLFKWGSLFTAAALVLLVFWFCTPAGFVPGFIVALILLVLGGVFLREKKTASAH
jgi:hypothetical protein